jgi:hypothetical protein
MPLEKIVTSALSRGGVQRDSQRTYGARSSNVCASRWGARPGESGATGEQGDRGASRWLKLTSISRVA